MRFYCLLIALFFVTASSSIAVRYSLDEDLLYRVNFGSARDVRLLLEQGANPNSRNHQNETCLQMTIERNDDETTGMAEALIEKGADLDTADKTGTAPIIRAIHYHQDGVVKALLAKGANYHITSADGTPIVQYAIGQGDKAAADMIQAMIGKEEDYANSFRTPERFHNFVKTYTMNSCVYQYWSYVIASRQPLGNQEQLAKKVEGIKNGLLNTLTEVQKYYAPASLQAMRSLGDQAVNQIYSILDVMISNTNRAEHGVGSETDVQKRCEAIVSGLNLDIAAVPSNREAVTFQRPPIASTPVPAPPAPPADAPPVPNNQPMASPPTSR